MHSVWREILLRVSAFLLPRYYYHLNQTVLLLSLLCTLTTKIHLVWWLCVKHQYWKNKLPILKEMYTINGHDNNIKNHREGRSELGVLWSLSTFFVSFKTIIDLFPISDLSKDSNWMKNYRTVYVHALTLSSGLCSIVRLLDMFLIWLIFIWFRAKTSYITAISSILQWKNEAYEMKPLQMYLTSIYIFFIKACAACKCSYIKLHKFRPILGHDEIAQKYWNGFHYLSLISPLPFVLCTYYIVYSMQSAYR